MRENLPALSLSLLAAANAAAMPAACAQQLTLPLWTHGAPEASTAKGPERDITTATDPLIAGKRIIKLTDVSEPTLTLYKPDAAANSGAAVLVLPGGGYRILAYDLEGTEVCAWLNSIHVTCVLVKYRVPYEGHFPERSEDLEDAQQAMRLTRQHAAEWGIDPKRIGVLGFSAGGHLAVVLSIHSDFDAKSAALKEHGGLGSEISARPDFALGLIPDIWCIGRTGPRSPRRLCPPHPRRRPSCCKPRTTRSTKRTPSFTSRR